MSEISRVDVTVFTVWISDAPKPAPISRDGVTAFTVFTVYMSNAPKPALMSRVGVDVFTVEMSDASKPAQINRVVWMSDAPKAAQISRFGVTVFSLDVRCPKTCTRVDRSYKSCGLFGWGRCATYK